MRAVMRACAVATAALLLAPSVLGCGGGGAGGGVGGKVDDAPRLSPPTQLVATQGDAFDAVTIAWTPPADAIDGYELQARLNSGDWRAIGNGLIPFNVVGGTLLIDASTPELAEFGFRLRSAKGADRSGWSSEASYLRGIRAPTSLTVAVSRTPGGLWRTPPVTLSWKAVSLVATDLLIERGPSGGPDASFQALSVTPGATTFADVDASEGTWTYRVRVGKGGVWSAPVSADAAIDIAPPRQLVAHKVAGGVQLTWTNRSTIGQQVVSRTDPGLVPTPNPVTLPVGASDYLDPIDAPWPATSYTVVSAVAPGLATAIGPTVLVEPFTIAGPVNFAGSASTVPGGLEVARTDAGRLHAAEGGFPDLVIHRDTGAGWDSHLFAGVPQYAGPGVLADELGNPHSVYYQGFPTQPTTTLVHGWYDGTSWQSEPIVTAPAENASFALGPGGTVHALVRRREPSGLFTTVHHVGRAGAYVATDLVATTLPPGLGLPGSEFGEDMGVGPDGTAWIALTYFAPAPAAMMFVVFRRAPDGIWSEELVPFGSPIAAATVIPGSGDAVALLFGAAPGVDAFRLRSSAGWGPEETPAVPFPGMDRRGAALSADGQRAHILYSTYPLGLWLTVRTSGGWQYVKMGAPPPQWARTGLTADGRITVVASHGSAVVPEPISVFVEVP